MERPEFARLWLPKPIRHWTTRGTFVLDFAEGPGGVVVSIYLNERYVGFQYTLKGAAQAVFDGGYDDVLGFPASSTTLPRDFEAWTDPLDILDRLK